MKGVGRTDLAALRVALEEHGTRDVCVVAMGLDGAPRTVSMTLEALWAVVERGLWIEETCLDATALERVAAPSEPGPAALECGAHDHAEHHRTEAGAQPTRDSVRARLDLASWSSLVAAPETAFLFADLYEADGKRPHPACPRSLLKRVVARAETAGLVPELEARVGRADDPDHARLRERGSEHAASESRELHRAVRVADRLVLESLSTRRSHAAEPCISHIASGSSENLAGTPRERRDASGTLWLRLLDSTGQTSVLRLPDRDGEPSRLARHLLGGMRALAPELAALDSLLSGGLALSSRTEAPLVSLDVERAALDRASGGIALPCAASHPALHVAIAAVLGAGLWGAQRAVDLPHPSEHAAPRTRHAYPRDGHAQALERAANALVASDAMREILGDRFVEHHVSRQARTIADNGATPRGGRGGTLPRADAHDDPARETHDDPARETHDDPVREAHDAPTHGRAFPETSRAASLELEAV